MTGLALAAGARGGDGDGGAGQSIVEDNPDLYDSYDGDDGDYTDEYYADAGEWVSAYDLNEPSCVHHEDSSPQLLNGTTACDVKVLGGDGQARVPIDGVYAMTGCQDGQPLYSLSLPDFPGGSGPGPRTLAFSHYYGEWTFYEGPDVNETRMIAHSDNYAAIRPQLPMNWFKDQVRITDDMSEGDDAFQPLGDFRVFCVKESEWEKELLGALNLVGTNYMSDDEMERAYRKLYANVTHQAPPVDRGTSKALVALFALAGLGIVVGIPAGMYWRGKRQPAVRFTRLADRQAEAEMTSVRAD